MTKATGAALFLFTAAAHAQPTDLTVDSTSSEIDLTITLDTAIGSRTDSDSAPISGTMRIELDSYTSPTTITLHEYSLVAGDLSYFFDYSFLGSISADASGLSLNMPASSGPVSGAVQTDGSFTVDNVPNETTGLVMITGTGVVGSAVNGTSVDLSTLAQDPIQISGVVSPVAGVVTLTVALPLAGSGTDPDTGTTVTFSGSATVIATGQVPEPGCVADTNGDGSLTPADFSAWIAAFNAQSPACDQNGDGLCTPADFSAWIANFNAGCP